MDVRKLIDAVAAGADPAQVLEDEPSTFSKISNFVFGRGTLSKVADGSASAGTPSSKSTGSNSGFAPSPGMGGKSLADLAADSASRQGIGKTSTVLHKSSAGSTSSPAIKSPLAPAAVKPVSSAPKISKPLTQSMESVDEAFRLFHPGQKVRVRHVDMYGYNGRDNHPEVTLKGAIGHVTGYLDQGGNYGLDQGWDGKGSAKAQGVKVHIKTGLHKGKTFDMVHHELEPYNESVLEYQDADDDEPEFNHGDKVRLHPDYEDKPGEVFTVGHQGSRRNTHWIGDKQGRGWYAHASQLIHHEGDEGDGDDDMDEAIMGMEHGLTKSSKIIARVKGQDTLFSKGGAKSLVKSLKNAVTPMMGGKNKTPRPHESRVSLLVQAVLEGANPNDVLRVAHKVMEGKTTVREWGADETSPHHSFARTFAGHDFEWQAPHRDAGMIFRPDHHSPVEGGSDPHIRGSYEGHPSFGDIPSDIHQMHSLYSDLIDGHVKVTDRRGEDVTHRAKRHAEIAMDDD